MRWWAIRPLVASKRATIESGGIGSWDANPGESAGRSADMFIYPELEIQSSRWKRKILPSQYLFTGKVDYFFGIFKGSQAPLKSIKLLKSIAASKILFVYLLSILLSDSYPIFLFDIWKTLVKYNLCKYIIRLLIQKSLTKTEG